MSAIDVTSMSPSSSSCAAVVSSNAVASIGMSGAS